MCVCGVARGLSAHPPMYTRKSTHTRAHTHTHKHTQVPNLKFLESASSSVTDDQLSSQPEPSNNSGEAAEAARADAREKKNVNKKLHRLKEQVGVSGGVGMGV